MGEQQTDTQLLLAKAIQTDLIHAKDKEEALEIMDAWNWFLELQCSLTQPPPQQEVLQPASPLA